MKEVILTMGPPGCGKSTWANEFVRLNPGYYILTRDDFREKLFGLDARNGYKYSKQREKAVSVAQLGAAGELLNLEATKGIIVADTNLNPITVKNWKEVCEKRGFKFTTKEFHVPWTELVKRNNYRGDKAVPIEVLRRMYADQNPKKYISSEYPEGRPEAVIFDIDGTLALMGDRSPYDLEKCGEDTHNTMVVSLLHMLEAKGYKILTVSGRESGTKEDPFKYYHMTTDWLNKFTIPESHFQRKQGDMRKDDIVKEEIFWRDIAPYYDVKLAIDDRNQVVEMWRRLGIECWQVNHGDF